MIRAPTGSINRRLDDLFFMSFDPYILNYEPSKGVHSAKIHDVVMHKITNLIPVRMECDGRLASGGDVKGWDRHEGGPGSSSVVDLEAILEGLLAHLIVVELIKNVLVTGGLVFDNVQEGLIDVV
uniref:Uncharacterized protein n=1 Tax=Vitis vinifera TaxID=29760 RepID=A5BGK4_VITVI|nr:hypothetical protein VITISV_042188 [Vitis vinifera]